MKILEKIIRSKYRRANPKNPVFSIFRRFKMHDCFRFVFFYCLFNLCTCSLLHEISSLTSIMHFWTAQSEKYWHLRGRASVFTTHNFLYNFYRLITTFHVCWQRKNKSFIVWNFRAQAIWNIFNSPHAYKIEHMKTKLTEVHTWCPILAVGCYWNP